MLVRSYKVFSALLMLMIIVGQTMTVSHASACDVDMFQMDMNQFDMSNMSETDHKDCCDNSVCTTNCTFTNGIMLNNATFVEVTQTSLQKFTPLKSLPYRQLSTSLFRPPIIG